MPANRLVLARAKTPRRGSFRSALRRSQPRALGARTRFGWCRLAERVQLGRRLRSCADSSRVVIGLAAQSNARVVDARAVHRGAGRHSDLASCAANRGTHNSSSHRDQPKAGRTWSRETRAQPPTDEPGRSTSTSPEGAVAQVRSDRGRLELAAHGALPCTTQRDCPKASYRLCRPRPEGRGREGRAPKSTAQAVWRTLRVTTERRVTTSTVEVYGTTAGWLHPARAPSFAGVTPYA